jgi:hypothetical protein
MRPIEERVFWYFLCGLLAASMACQQSRWRHLAQQEALSETAITARPGDTIVISLDGSFGDLKYIVTPDGRIDLPTQRSIVAAGKTAIELEKDIQDLYVQSVLRRFTVTVRIEPMRKRRFAMPTSITKALRGTVPDFGLFTLRLVSDLSNGPF